MTAAAGLRRSYVRGGDGVGLAVTELGDAAAPAWVVAHGVGSHSRFVRDAFGPALVEAGWRLVSYDLRGHGDSDPVRRASRHGLDHHVADLAAVVAATAARRVGGVSLGGHVAVTFATCAPVEGVVACLPAWTGRAVPGEGPHAAVAEDVRRIGVAGLIDRFREDVDMEPWLRAVLRRDWPAHDPASLQAALVALDGACAPTELELRSLAVPLGLVAWPDDPGHPLQVAQDWAAWAPHARLVTISLADLDPDPAALGRAACAALP